MAECVFSVLKAGMSLVWTEEEKQILTELKKTCLIHMFLQSGSAYVNNVVHNAITLPNIGIGAVLSVSIFSTEDPKWKLASGILALTTTVLSALSRQLGASERAHLHASVAKQYQGLIRDVNMKLLMPCQQEDRSQFIITVKNEIDKLFSIQPEPSIHVMRQFERKYHKHIEMALYPEFANMEQAYMKHAERITDKARSSVAIKPRVSNYYKRLMGATTIVGEHILNPNIKIDGGADRVADRIERGERQERPRTRSDVIA